ncbi:ORF6N domain-containing protein [Enterocloster bolteae]|uniref:ORF6N domain-containing protein n=1 Tax=Enterocloster bolteae TaxID=208479 RepID=UPI002A80B7E1|nr:ORF6N domain-containing protein [Enterocloster bolteae]
MTEERQEATELKEKRLQEIMTSDNTIRNLIFVVRGQQVMMDSDLAALYQVETKVFNQAVKRNVARFPDAFRFQLTDGEYADLRSQIVTSNGRGGRRYLPYVFTEQGIAMLSAVLNSDIAIQVSIQIMTAFVEMRSFLVNNTALFEKISELNWRQQEYEKKTDERFEKVFDYIAENNEVKQKIFFDGQIYDAFSLLVELVGKAEKSIILIDNYVDVDTLNILAKKKRNVNVCIYTVKQTKLTAADVRNFNRQYPKLEVKYTGVFHDRFLIIDDYFAYHIGASLKDAGKKCFGINLMEDEGTIKGILNIL